MLVIKTIHFAYQDGSIVMIATICQRKSTPFIKSGNKAMGK